MVSVHDDVWGAILYSRGCSTGETLHSIVSQPLQLNIVKLRRPQFRICRRGVRYQENKVLTSNSELKSGLFPRSSKRRDKSLFLKFFYVGRSKPHAIAQSDYRDSSLLNPFINGMWTQMQMLCDFLQGHQILFHTSPVPDFRTATLYAYFSSISVRLKRLCHGERPSV